jgi:hypothetical protein
MASDIPIQIIASTQTIAAILEPKSSGAIGFLAIWGALLSTANVAWTMARDWNDRGRIRISAMIGRVISQMPGQSDQKDYVCLTITNVGKRPIKITNVGGQYFPGTKARSHFIVVGQNYPKILPETEDIMEKADVVDDLRNIKTFIVYDSSGRKWRVSWKIMNQLRKQAATPAPTTR